MLFCSLVLILTVEHPIYLRISNHYLPCFRYMCLKCWLGFCYSYMNKLFLYRQNTLIRSINHLQIGEKNYVTLTWLKFAARNQIGHWHRVFSDISYSIQKKYNKMWLSMHCSFWILKCKFCASTNTTITWTYCVQACTVAILVCTE